MDVPNSLEKDDDSYNEWGWFMQLTEVNKTFFDARVNT